jgi:hypothetical protein
MGAPETVLLQQMAPQVEQTTYTERQQTALTKDEMAERYQKWQSSHKAKSDYDRAFDAVRHLMPDWFLFSALIAGVFVLGMIMLKVNPLLKPIKNAVVWFLDFCEGFLKRDKPDEAHK